MELLLSGNEDTIDEIMLRRKVMMARFPYIFGGYNIWFESIVTATAALSSVHVSHSSLVSPS